jgi:hypothetical protein
LEGALALCLLSHTTMATAQSERMRRQLVTRQCNGYYQIRYQINGDVIHEHSEPQDHQGKGFQSVACQRIQIWRLAHHSLVSLANRMLRLVVQGKYWPYLLLSPPRKAACLLAIAREQQHRLSNSNPRGTTYRHLYISRRKNSYR